MYNFAEALPHYVDQMWVILKGVVSYTAMTGPEVRCWVRGFDDRATFGHRSTIQKLAKAVIAIQKQDRLQRLAEHKVFYNGLPFVGRSLASSGTTGQILPRTLPMVPSPCRWSRIRRAMKGTASCWCLS